MRRSRWWCAATAGAAVATSTIPPPFAATSRRAPPPRSASTTGSGSRTPTAHSQRATRCAAIWFAACGACVPSWCSPTTRARSGRIIAGIAQPGHSDHRAAGQATLDAIYPRSPSPNFYAEQLGGDDALKPWYPREVWLFDTAQPDLRIDAADGFERKRASLFAHASQEEAVGGLVAAARAMGAHWGSAQRPAEAFVRLRLY